MQLQQRQQRQQRDRAQCEVAMVPWEGNELVKWNSSAAVRLPTALPTRASSKLAQIPTKIPTKILTKIPTRLPSQLGCLVPTNGPTRIPTVVSISKFYTHSHVDSPVANTTAVTALTPRRSQTKSNWNTAWDSNLPTELHDNWYEFLKPVVWNWSRLTSRKTVPDEAAAVPRSMLDPAMERVSFENATSMKSVGAPRNSCSEPVELNQLTNTTIRSSLTPTDILVLPISMEVGAMIESSFEQYRHLVYQPLRRGQISKRLHKHQEQKRKPQNKHQPQAIKRRKAQQQRVRYADAAFQFCGRQRDYQRVAEAVDHRHEFDRIVREYTTESSRRLKSSRYRPGSSLPDLDCGGLYIRRGQRLRAHSKAMRWSAQGK